MTAAESEGERELHEEEQEGPIVRDRRRIDPETGRLREPAQQQAPAAEPSSITEDGAGSATVDEQIASLQAQLSERIADVQRIQAEYANYRKRVDRDREQVSGQAVANVLGDLLPVLDDIGRAREHDELHGGFRQVAESLEQITSKLGLVRYGEPGDEFDPSIHEALMHSYSSEVTVTICGQVLQPGYAVHDRVLRPARVAVVEPEEPGSEQEAPEAERTADAEPTDG